VKEGISIVDALDQGFWQAPASTPIRHRAEWIGLEQTYLVAGLPCRDPNPNGKCALAGAALA
jgi:hypothetical protein